MATGARRRAWHVGVLLAFANVVGGTIGSAAAAETKARQAKGDTRRAGSLATRAAAFTTYVPFPLEEERVRLLGSL